MIKIKVRGKSRKESDFVYKWAMEWLGRSVEFGISKKEFGKFIEKTRNLLIGPKKLGALYGINSSNC